MVENNDFECNLDVHMHFKILANVGKNKNIRLYIPIEEDDSADP